MFPLQRRYYFVFQSYMSTNKYFLTYELPTIIPMRVLYQELFISKTKAPNRTRKPIPLYAYTYTAFLFFAFITRCFISFPLQWVSGLQILQSSETSFCDSDKSYLQDLNSWWSPNENTVYLVFTRSPAAKGEALSSCCHSAAACNKNYTFADTIQSPMIIAFKLDKYVFLRA